MPKITYDYSDVNINAGGFAPYEGPTPRPGVYNATITSCVLQTSKAGNAMLRVVYQLGYDAHKPEKNVFAGAPIFDYVTPGEAEIQKIRVGQLLKAVCGKQKAVIDADDIEAGGTVNKIGGKAPKGTHVKLVLTNEQYNDQPQARVQRVEQWPAGQDWPEGPAATGPATDDDDDEEVEVEDDDVEEEELDDDEEIEDEEDEESEEDERAEELAALSRNELKAILKGLDPKAKVLKSTTDDALRTAILDLEFGEEEEEDAEGEPPF